MGPSGSGKSTLLHCLAGSCAPDAGSVRLPAAATSRRCPTSSAARCAARDFGFVFQFGQLVPELTCVENVALPLRLDGSAAGRPSGRPSSGWSASRSPTSRTSARARSPAARAQRVAVARALVTGPRVRLRRRAHRRPRLAQRRAGDAPADGGRPRDERRSCWSRTRLGSRPMPTARSSSVTGAPANRGRGVRAVASSTAAPPGRSADRARECRRGSTRWSPVAMGARPRGRRPGGWLRTAMTAVGVGLGVAVLLVAAAVPTMLSARTARADARDDYSSRAAGRREDVRRRCWWRRSTPRSATSDPRSAACEPDGPRAPLPPGVRAFPGAATSSSRPRCGGCSTSADGALLRQRLPGKIVGTIEPAGLTGPSEYAFSWAATASCLRPRLGQRRARRIDHFGNGRASRARSTPCCCCSSSSSWSCCCSRSPSSSRRRCGSAAMRRDRRLAALRLVGADRRMTRRIAAGEALLGAASASSSAPDSSCSAGRSPVVSRCKTSVSSRVTSAPSVVLAALIALAVPAAAVRSLLASMRRTIIEPLGVVRRGAVRPAGCGGACCFR